jgi:hypothetical protein
MISASLGHCHMAALAYCRTERSARRAVFRKARWVRASSMRHAGPATSLRTLRTRGPCDCLPQTRFNTSGRKHKEGCVRQARTPSRYIQHDFVSLFRSDQSADAQPMLFCRSSCPTGEAHSAGSSSSRRAVHLRGASPRRLPPRRRVTRSRRRTGLCADGAKRHGRMRKWVVAQVVLPWAEPRC